MSLLIAECEEMLKTFRCQDLANLLAYAGQSKNGKKSELYDRCIAILRRGHPNIQFKIKEIHSSRLTTTNNCYPNLIAPNSSSSTSNSPDPISTRYGSSASLNQHQLLAATASLNAAFNPQSGYIYPNLPITGQNTFSRQTSQIRIVYEKLAFYEHIAEVNQAVRLIGLNPNSRPLTFSFSFSLNQEQINEILNNRTISNGKFEHSKQVHLRFGFYDSSTQKDNLPANLVVNVNQKPAQLPTPKPTSKPNADIIRPGRSIDVTHLIRLAPNMTNKVELNWTNVEVGKTHCVAVYFYRKVSVQSLVDYLKSNKTIDGEQTKKMVREKLQISDSDFEIETNFYKVSLQCPLMKFRIQIPTRATSCKHVQCFDLESYLMMNEKKPTWLCPVCDQHTPFDNLVIDSLFKDILNKCTDCDEIQFNSEAEWSRVTKPNEKTKPTSSTSTTKIETETVHSPIKSANSSISKIEASIVDICENDSMTADEPMKSEKAPEADTAKKKEVVIDLTLDSDEEDNPPKHQIPQLKQSSSVIQNQLNESLNEADNVASPSSVSIISLSSSASNSPIHNNDPRNLRPMSTNQSPVKTRQPLSVDTIRNAALTSPVSSVGSNGSDNLMNASPIINTPPASIGPENLNSRLARDISSPKRAPNSTDLKQTSSLASVESIVNNTNKTASNYIQQQQHQSKNTSNRPINQVQQNPAQRPQQPVNNKPHGLLNSNNKIQKPVSTRADYLTKEKAHLLNEQVRSSRSPNLADMDPNASIYRLKETSIGSKMASQLAKIDSELNTNRMPMPKKPMPGYPSQVNQQQQPPFFINNKNVPNGSMNNVVMNGMNPMAQQMRQNTPNKHNSQMNPNYSNPNVRMHPQQHHYQMQPGQHPQQQYHGHHYT